MAPPTRCSHSEALGAAAATREAAPMNATTTSWLSLGSQLTAGPLSGAAHGRPIWGQPAVCPLSLEILCRLSPFAGGRLSPFHDRGLGTAAAARG